MCPMKTGRVIKKLPPRFVDKQGWDTPHKGERASLRSV
jgi:hypothetical protein